MSALELPLPQTNPCQPPQELGNQAPQYRSTTPVQATTAMPNQPSMSTGHTLPKDSHRSHSSNKKEWNWHERTKNSDKRGKRPSNRQGKASGGFSTTWSRGSDNLHMEWSDKPTSNTRKVHLPRSPFLPYSALESPGLPDRSSEPDLARSLWNLSRLEPANPWAYLSVRDRPNPPLHPSSRPQWEAWALSREPLTRQALQEERQLDATLHGRVDRMDLQDAEEVVAAAEEEALLARLHLRGLQLRDRQHPGPQPGTTWTTSTRSPTRTSSTRAPSTSTTTNRHLQSGTVGPRHRGLGTISMARSPTTTRSSEDGRAIRI